MLHYLVCATPRVGSNLLCSLLWGTRAVGHPREYFCPFQIAEYGPALIDAKAVTTAADLHRFLDRAAEAFGTNERFGIKAHLHQLRAALQLGYDFDGRFPDRFVHITRADVIGQAISLVRAAQTRAWTAQKREIFTPEYSSEQIRDAVQKIITDNQAWEALFRAYDIEPHRLSYERLCADFEGELSAVLAFLDVDPGTVDVPKAVRAATSYFKQQRDATSADWRARYVSWVRTHAAQHPLRRASEAGQVADIAPVTF
ncbi:MAG: Stf0 family sulfotransferase [Planctomycetota bacterium]